MGLIQINQIPLDCLQYQEDIDFVENWGGLSPDSDGELDQKWNWFVEVIEGDESSPQQINIENPISPSEVLEEWSEVYVSVSGYMKDEYPEWFQQMGQSRELAKSIWAGDYYFCPEEYCYA